MIPIDLSLKLQGYERVTKNVFIHYSLLVAAQKCQKYSSANISTGKFVSVEKYNFKPCRNFIAIYLRRTHAPFLFEPNRPSYHP